MEKLDIKTFHLEEILHLYKHYENILSDEIDPQIMRDFQDDFDEPNVWEEKAINKVKRYQKYVNKAKRKYSFACQICGCKFLMDSGGYYCEAHHIKPLASDGSQRDEENIIILCANHHRMFHYAREQIYIGKLINGKRIITINQQRHEVIFI